MLERFIQTSGNLSLYSSRMDCLYTGDDMGLKQFQRGMRHRLKYIQLRLRLRVRHLSRHRKTRNAVALPYQAPLPRSMVARPQGEQKAIAAPARAALPAMPLPTLRRTANRTPEQ
jgi:hypothetical protein